MHSLSEWTALADNGVKVMALEAASVERRFIFSFFVEQAKRLGVTCYLWNTGYDQLHSLQSKGEDECLHFVPTGLFSGEDVLSWLREQVPPGIFLVEDLTNFDGIDSFTEHRRESQILNLLGQFWSDSSPCYLVLLGDTVELGARIRAQVPLLKLPLPSEAQVQSLVEEFCRQRGWDGAEPLAQRQLVSACQGLARGEIELALSTYSPLCDSPASLTERLLDYKKGQFRSLGLEFIAEPDVDTAGGLDRLRQYLIERVVKLNEPSARLYGLRPPRGLLLLGPPGTGKTLCAKLAAKALGYTLLALSWGNVLGSDNPDKTLAKILEVADSLDRCVLLADDFDKGFTGWESGGVSRRLSQRLLTWMQEHTSHVLTIATVNRIKLLPSEIKRRFDDGGIWFVDLPSMGALYEIFNIHLRKYFPTQFGEGSSPWSDQQWYVLLRKYRGATPVEIANAVARCAQDCYCRLSESERREASGSPTVTVEALIAQLAQFEMASQRDSDDLQHIRNTAYYARPAASADTSRFAIQKQELFEYRRHDFEEA